MADTESEALFRAQNAAAILADSYGRVSEQCDQLRAELAEKTRELDDAQEELSVITMAYAAQGALYNEARAEIERLREAALRLWSNSYRDEDDTGREFFVVTVETMHELRCALAALPPLTTPPAPASPVECAECPKYVGKCPACHRKRPSPAESREDVSTNIETPDMGRTVPTSRTSGTLTLRVTTKEPKR